MAVDTCPNALALDSSEYFGEKLIEYAIEPLINSGFNNEIVKHSTILRNGELTDDYLYLKDFVNNEY